MASGNDHYIRFISNEPITADFTCLFKRVVVYLFFGNFCKILELLATLLLSTLLCVLTVAGMHVAKAPCCCWRQRCSMFMAHASAAEIHPAVANNLSAVSVPGAIVVACFPAVADAQVFCCCWRSYSGTAVYPTVLAVFWNTF